MKLNGFKDVQRQLKALTGKAKAATNIGLQQTAQKILQDALANVPVDKGQLRSSMGTELLPDKMIAKIYAAAAYAAYQEFGTGSFTEVPSGYEQYAMEFFVDGTGTNRPQPFLLPATFNNQDKLIPLIEAELIKLLRNG